MLTVRLKAPAAQGHGSPSFLHFVLYMGGMTVWEQLKTPCAQQNSWYETTVPSVADNQGALISFRVKMHWGQSHL